MDQQSHHVAEAFSRKALVYDEFGLGHENLERMREKVRQHALAYLKAGDRILEINAGTGGDAAFFAGRGFRVHATDIAPGMVAQIEEKIRRYRLEDRLTAQQCSFSDLDQVIEGCFQYVLSNMGGVNCTDDLCQVAQGLQRLLAPGAYVTWVVMPRVCLWELVGILRGDYKTATRRLRKGGILANVEGVQFQTFYYSPEEVRHAFGKPFRVVRIQGLSVLTPPADYHDFARKHLRMFALLRSLDDHLSDRYPFNRWGDFFILTLKYEPSTP